MRILLFSDQFHPVKGGIEQYVRGLCLELVRQGQDVFVLTRTGDDLPAQETDSGITVVRTDALCDAILDPFLVMNRWRDILPLVERMNADVIYANHHTSLAAIKIAGTINIPVVYGCHGWGLLCPLSQRYIKSFLKPDLSLCHNERSKTNCRKCYRMLNLPDNSGPAMRRWGGMIRAQRLIDQRVTRYDRFQQLLHAADARIVPARRWRSFFREDNTFHVPYGIQTEIFHPVDLRSFQQEYGITSPYLLTTSRIVAHKGQAWAIEALRHLPVDLKLVVAGNTSLSPAAKYEENEHMLNLRRTTESLGLKERVIFTGRLETTELVQAYSGALATIIPSIWLDPYPNVCLEAMACGCPVVVSESCGTAELIDPGKEGFIVPRMDAPAIAEAVRKIVPQRTRMGECCRRKVMSELVWPYIAPKILKIFEKIIEGKIQDERRTVFVGK